MKTIATRWMVMPLLAAGLAGCASMDDLEIGEESEAVQLGAVGDLRVNLDGFGSARNGTEGTVYATVVNLGKASCAVSAPNIYGYYPTASGYTGAVLFAVTSVGPAPASLAPGQRWNVIGRNVSSNAGLAIEKGFVYVTVPGCGGEVDTSDNTAHSFEKKIANPTSQPDAHVHIDGYASGNGYVTVTNFGNKGCTLATPTAYGYYPVAGSAILFDVTSAGVKPAILGPGESASFVFHKYQDPKGAQAMAGGFVEVNLAACYAETATTSNRATIFQGTIQNPSVPGSF